jgi:hypothetical protein
MASALKSGCVYFLLVFVVGFALGTVRALFLAPLFGEMFAVSIELPIILLVSWLICRALIERFAVPATVTARALMGAIALALLLGAEVLLSLLLLGQSITQHLELYQSAEGLTGLAGQIVFALFPGIQLAMASD